MIENWRSIIDAILYSLLKFWATKRCFYYKICVLFLKPILKMNITVCAPVKR